MEIYRADNGGGIRARPIRNAIKQAAAYRKLAADRATRYGLPARSPAARDFS
jgi:hypothetical protein